MPRMLTIESLSVSGCRLVRVMNLQRKYLFSSSSCVATSRSLSINQKVQPKSKRRALSNTYSVYVESLKNSTCVKFNARISVKPWVKQQLCLMNSNISL